MASGPITSWQIDGETVETVSDFFEGAPKKLQMVTAAMKLRRLLLGRKVMTNLDSIFWGRQWHPTPVLLPGKSNGTPPQYSCLENPMDRGAWWAAVHGVAKSWTQLSNFPFTFHFHALEKEMATHSSVLAWRIPGMVEPGGLPSMGSHRVRPTEVA